jgi:hypothetical protein
MIAVRGRPVCARHWRQANCISRTEIREIFLVTIVDAPNRRRLLRQPRLDPAKQPRLSRIDRARCSARCHGVIPIKQGFSLVGDMNEWDFTDNI